MKTATITHDDIPATYAELVSLCVPRPLHNETDYAYALQVMEAMAGFELNDDQEDYFDAISTFVEKYEERRHPVATGSMSPVDLLRFLMDEHDMSESDLGRLLGDRSLGHRILSGERELSKAHIRKLSDYFAVSTDVLLATR